MTDICESLENRRLKEFREYIVSQVSTIRPTTIMDGALREFMEKGPNLCLYVVDDENCLVGRIRFPSITGALFPYDNMRKHGTSMGIAKRSAFAVSIAKDLMESCPEVLRESDTVGDLARKVEITGEDSLPVIDSFNRLVGQISLHQILSANMTNLEEKPCTSHKVGA
ncbi:MAG: CBS domain-containing protein [Planctomycetes bacterium]|nr:CBS domain-containing protein [Planctomycetota bacterium]